MTNLHDIDFLKRIWGITKIYISNNISFPVYGNLSLTLPHLKWSLFETHHQDAREAQSAKKKRIQYINVNHRNQTENQLKDWTSWQTSHWSITAIRIQTHVYSLERRHIHQTFRAQLSGCHGERSLLHAQLWNTPLGVNLECETHSWVKWVPLKGQKVLWEKAM